MRPAAEVQPLSFGDPVAAQTQWTPLVKGGANFTTHRLVDLGPRRVEMKPTLGLRAFGGVFLVVGVIVSVVGLIAMEWFPTLFGLPFAAIGAWVLWPKPLVFDGEARVFTRRQGQVPFSAIHAVQLIRERVTSSEDPDYWSYELNLVLGSGERINVVDHAGLSSIRSEAQRLAGLIGCKVWDAA